MKTVYKEYTKERLEQTMKEHQGIDFLNFINEMLNDGWSLTKIDKAKIMTKKAIRERMRKMGAMYDPMTCQYVMQDTPQTYIKEIQKEDCLDVNNMTNVLKEDIKPLNTVYKNDTKEIQPTEVNLSNSNVELLQSLELAMKQLTKQMTKLNENTLKLNHNGIKVNGSVSPAPITESNSNGFIAKRFDKDDQLINRNHRFYNSVLERLNAFHEDYAQYNLQLTLNSLLSEALEKHGY